MLTFLVAWILADFFAGIVHWAEDRLLMRPQKLSFLETIRIDNIEHHRWPAKVIQYSLWENLRISAFIAWPVALGLFLLGCPTLVWLTVFLASWGNIVHRFAHLPRARVPRVVRYLQKVGIFVSIAQHSAHHADENGLISKENTTKTYCVMTGWLNPILDRLKFFNLLDWLFRPA